MIEEKVAKLKKKYIDDQNFENAYFKYQTAKIRLDLPDWIDYTPNKSENCCKRGCKSCCHCLCLNLCCCLCVKLCWRKQIKYDNNNIQRAFVIFRSMEGKQRVLKTYSELGGKLSWWQQFKSKFCGEKSEQTEVNEWLKFMDKYDLKVK